MNTQQAGFESFTGEEKLEKQGYATAAVPRGKWSYTKKGVEDRSPEFNFKISFKLQLSKVAYNFGLGIILLTAGLQLEKYTSMGI